MTASAELEDSPSMCGIVGLWQAARSTDEELRKSALRMSDALTHRGPDDFGTWQEAARGLAFGFRRLSIIDLSQNGHQPMRSRTGRFTIVFNGEIYNHPELGAELGALGHAFVGHSDTEIALAAFEEWGVTRALERFVGMFAIAVWDAQRRVLAITRDRLGIKPVFLYQRAGTFAFASELKALFALPGFSGGVNPEALACYFRYLYVPAPMAIVEGVTKLLPGHMVELQGPDDALVQRSYWSAREVAVQGARPEDMSDAEAVAAVERTVLDAVRLRLRADVPVGAFLSGGIDSSVVVSMMQEVSPRQARTFTVGFDVQEHDEAAHARAVAAHLGTEHHEIHLSGADALALVPTMASIFDEPLADPSNLPTYLVCQAARQEVVVALSGDGGDEVFGGYNRYGYGTRIIPRAARLPGVSRRALAGALSFLRPATWDQLYGVAQRLLPVPHQRLVGDKLHKLSNLLRASTTPMMYRSLMSAWQHPPVRAGDGNDPRATSAAGEPGLTLLQQMMLADQISYLPDDLLAKVDRASMAVSLEVRVPLLDHRVVELSWRLPDRMKVRDGRSKWVLRELLGRRVPRSLTERPKVGFSVPLASWLRGPLRPWAEGYLRSEQLAAQPYLDAARIRRVWDGFLLGNNSEQLAIWTVLMFESWREQWLRA